MAYEVTFSALTPEQTAMAIDLAQKIAAIDAQLAVIADERANAEAVWRAKENFLRTEKGKAEIAYRDIRIAAVKVV